jgi:hypothetical protein
LAAALARDHNAGFFGIDLPAITYRSLYLFSFRIPLCPLSGFFLGRF